MNLTKDGSLSANANEIAKFVSESTWSTLSKKWEKRRCKWLARLAKQILEAKKASHDIPAKVADKVFKATQLHEPERRFFSQLVRNIPLPHDKALVEAARSVRIAGVSLCIASGYPMEACCCFEDLAIDMTHLELKQFLIHNPDWMNLPGAQRR